MSPGKCLEGVPSEPRTGCRGPLGKEGLREHQITPKGPEPQKQACCKAQELFLNVQWGTFSHQGSLGSIQGSSVASESQCPSPGNSRIVSLRENKATWSTAQCTRQDPPIQLPLGTEPFHTLLLHRPVRGSWSWSRDLLPLLPRPQQPLRAHLQQSQPEALSELCSLQCC